MISMRHPQRESKQYVFSDRDIAYLEKQGWVREKPPEPALMKPSGVAPVKRGRPRKS